MTGLTEWARAELERMGANDLRRSLNEPLRSPIGPVVTVGDKTLINFSSNDYLGLAADPRLRAAAVQAIEHWGLGAGASRLVVGDTEAHHRLEQALAAFERKPAALVFGSGYATNVGVLSALAGPGDVIFSDALNHASIIDGCRLSRAQVIVYPHSDVESLEHMLETHPGKRRLVVTDAVFSMDGDRAPVREIAALCHEHDAALIVDEAHATGVMGATGAGLCEHESVTPDVVIGTLSKSFGGFGGYVATDEAVREIIVNRARSGVFSTALPAHLAATMLRSLEIITTDGSLQRRLQEIIMLFSDGLRARGISAHDSSAIFSIICGAPKAALNAAQVLRERGLLVKPMRPPTVPEHTARLRITLTAKHTDAHIEALLEGVDALLANGMLKRKNIAEPRTR